jgi:hypothetical protein
MCGQIVAIDDEQFGPSLSKLSCLSILFQFLAHTVNLEELAATQTIQ